MREGGGVDERGARGEGWEDGVTDLGSPCWLLGDVGAP